MIKIIGTSHISPRSVQNVRNIILKEKPRCVAIELDANRLQALRSGEKINIKVISQIGFRNYLLAKIFSIIQNYLGKKTGIFPGEEMLTAFNAAREVGADIALIDQDIVLTLNKLRAIPFSEKINLFFSFFFGMNAKKFDLNKIPSEKLINHLLSKIKKKAPTFYKVLVEERNIHMAYTLYHLSHKYETMVAVVGAGHRKGLMDEVEKLKLNEEAGVAS